MADVEVYDVLSQGVFAQAVDVDWARAGEPAVGAVPFHLCGGSALVGFHPYDAYVKLVGGGESGGMDESSRSPNGI